MINPILPIFVVTVLHEGMDKLGLIIAIATFVSYALRLVSGYISDRLGIIKPLVVGRYTLPTLSKPLMGFTQEYKGVATIKAIERLEKGLRSDPKDLLVAKYSHVNALGKTFGFQKTLDVSGVIWEHLGMKMVLTFSFVGTFLTVIIFMLTRMKNER